VTRGFSESRPAATPRPTIAFTLPADVEPFGGTSLVLRDATHGVVWRGTAWIRTGKLDTVLALAPGDYTIEATCDDLRANGTITVSSPGSAQTLALRKP